MPSIDKAERRERKRVKAISAKYENIRYRTRRAGQSLATREAERKTLLEGEPAKKNKRRKK